MHEEEILLLHLLYFMLKNTVQDILGIFFIKHEI